MEKAQLLRTLPAIDRVLKSATARALKERWLGRLVDDEIRRVVADLRHRIHNIPALTRCQSMNGSTTIRLHTMPSDQRSG